MMFFNLKKDFAKDGGLSARGQTKLAISLVLLVIMISVCLLIVYDFDNTAKEYVEASNQQDDYLFDSKAKFRKQYEAKVDAQIEEGSTGGSSSKDYGNTDNGKIGDFPIEYFCMFPLYEAADPFDVNKRDGGFGPIQETHSGLGTTIDRMYDSDPDTFSMLKPFVENPTTYLFRCDGNDHANHKWPNRYRDGQGGKTSTSGCVSHYDGSMKLVEALRPMLDTPEGTKKFYDEFITASREYFDAAEAKVMELTGKSKDEVGRGTVAALAGVYVRYGTGFSNNVLSPGMTDDQIIEACNAAAYSKGGEARFKCCLQLAKDVNAGIVNVYGHMQCNGACGTSHASNQNNMFGTLFGVEGTN